MRSAGQGFKGTSGTRRRSADWSREGTTGTHMRSTGWSQKKAPPSRTCAVPVGDIRVTSQLALRSIQQEILTMSAWASQDSYNLSVFTNPVKVNPHSGEKISLSPRKKGFIYKAHRAESDYGGECPRKAPAQHGPHNKTKPRTPRLTESFGDYEMRSGTTPDFSSAGRA
ncbi:hypothetical protein CesoFtcFv8_014110 [Champsocephalus esox]|uniref:Uncharacterized protein n=1 Tax=Champsocephalus esox TaxID=159716 RepID=A0AAN8BSE7_9TELE|nr:hypothetical protein CesoFtcFv8_014110 [Champsocephalus esox]